MTDEQRPPLGAVTYPAPPVPLDCELRDFKFMPVDVQRLRSSEQNSDVTPQANWAAMLLWSASWHELPAGSIPDNDQWIAKACGYVSLGTIDPRWGDVREGALRKFVKCSDGRLYHPIVCEKALEAWAAKLLQRWKSECARIKKHNERHKTHHPKPTYEQWIAAGRPIGQPLSVPGDKAGDNDVRPESVPGDKHSKGQRQGQGSKKNPKGSSGGAGAPATGKPVPTKRCPPEFEVTAALVLWADEKCPGLNIQRETERLRNHQFRDAHSDWPATWRNWMMTAYDDVLRVTGKAHGSYIGKPSGATAYQQRMVERAKSLTGGLTAKPKPNSERQDDETPTHRIS